MSPESFDSEQQFRLMVEAAPNGMLLVDEQGMIVVANASALRQFGYEREELLGKSVEMLIPGPFRSDHRQHRAGFIQAPQTRSMGGGRELSGLPKDGSEFPVEIGLTPIQTTKGMRVVASIVDITERRQIEQAIRHSEERYRRLAEVSSDAVLVNRGVRIVFINDQGIKLFGANSPDDIVGKSLLEFIHPDDHTAVRARIQELIEGRESVPLVEEKILGLDGRVVDVEISAARFTDHEGTGIQIVFRDISERKQAKQQLQKERDFIDAVLEVAGALVVVLDRDGRIL